MTKIEMNSLSTSQRSQMDLVTRAIENLNCAIKQAVDNGLTIELTRSCRHHGAGNWGDVMSPQFLTRE